MLIKYLPMDEEMLLQELENVGRTWAALIMMYGPCTDGVYFSATKMTLSLLSLSSTGISSLDSLPLY